MTRTTTKRIVLEKQNWWRILFNWAKLPATNGQRSPRRSRQRTIFEPIDQRPEAAYVGLDAIVGRESPDGQLRQFRIEVWRVANSRPENRHFVGKSEIYQTGRLVFRRSFGPLCRRPETLRRAHLGPSKSIRRTAGRSAKSRPSPVYGWIRTATTTGRGSHRILTNGHGRTGNGRLQQVGQDESDRRDPTKRRPRPSNILNFAGTKESHAGQTRSWGTLERLSTLSQTGRLTSTGTKTATPSALWTFRQKSGGFYELLTISRCGIDGIYRQTTRKLDRVDWRIFSPSIHRVRPLLFIPAIDSVRVVLSVDGWITWIDCDRKFLGPAVRPFRRNEMGRAL